MNKLLVARLYKPAHLEAAIEALNNAADANDKEAATVIVKALHDAGWKLVYVGKEDGL